MWGTFLSEPLSIVDSVGRYPADYLMERIPIPDRSKPFFFPLCNGKNISRIILTFARLSTCLGQVGYALLTRAPVAIKTVAGLMLPLDLHVLSL